MLQILVFCLLGIVIQIFGVFLYFNKIDYFEEEDIYFKLKTIFSILPPVGGSFWSCAVVCFISYLFTWRYLVFYVVYAPGLLNLINLSIKNIIGIDDLIWEESLVRKEFFKRRAEGSNEGFNRDNVDSSIEQYIEKKISIISLVVFSISFVLTFSMIFDSTLITKVVLILISLISFCVTMYREFVGIWEEMFKIETYNLIDLLFLYIHPLTLLLIVILSFL